MARDFNAETEPQAEQADDAPARKPKKSGVRRLFNAAALVGSGLFVLAAGGLGAFGYSASREDDRLGKYLAERDLKLVEVTDVNVSFNGDGYMAVVEFKGKYPDGTTFDGVSERRWGEDPYVIQSNVVNPPSIDEKAWEKLWDLNGDTPPTPDQDEEEWKRLWDLNGDTPPAASPSASKPAPAGLQPGRA